MIQNLGVSGCVTYDEYLCYTALEQDGHHSYWGLRYFKHATAHNGADVHQNLAKNYLKLGNNYGILV